MQATVRAIRPDESKVDTAQGTLDYDFLIVAPGSVLKDDPMVQGVEAPWELEHALALRERLARFQGGKVVVGPVS